MLPMTSILKVHFVYTKRERIGIPPMDITSKMKMKMMQSMRLRLPVVNRTVPK
jgi:hypothetical protein